MAKCPKCGEEICYLDYEAVIEVAGRYIVESYKESKKRWIAELYLCPLCNEALFEDQNDADEFLEGIKYHD